MKKVVNFLNNKYVKQILILLFLTFAVVWAGKGIFKYNVFSTHDGNHHLSRSFDAIATIREGHFPLRWAGSLNYYCGVPIYNFFYPLIYYLVIVIDYIHPDVILALKIIDFLALLFGTLFFYFWIKVETKKDIPAIGGSLLYLYAPYRFSLIFVRGSPEFLAYAILPIVLYFYCLLLESKDNKNVYYAFLASLSGAFLAISHNFTVMFLFPIILAYLIFKFIYLKASKTKIYWSIFSFISSFGLSSFFIGPAVLEKKYTKIGENFLMWQEHFPTLGQLIRSPWGYFYSSLGTINDGMSFMLGYAHWVVLFLGLLFIVFQIIKKKFNPWIILTFLLSVFTIYLILPISIPLWEKLPMLQEIQFSWRLLGVAVFALSSLFSFILSSINSKKLLWTVFIPVVLLSYIGNRNHLLPQPVSVEEVYKYEDHENLHQHRHSTTTLGDDVIAKGADVACWFNDPLISINNLATNHNIVERGNTYGFVRFITTKSDLETKKPLKLSIGYFPGAFNFEINGQKVKSSMCDGKNCFDSSLLKLGENTISWKVVQTPIQQKFNYLSVLFLIIWIILVFTETIGNRKGKTDEDGKSKMFLFALGFVFVTFLFFRGFNLEGRLGFGWDQERDSIAISEILKGDIKLIGPRVYGPTGFFLPPYFFYILTPFYLINNLSPFSVIYFILFFAVCFFLISYRLFSKMFNRKIALIFTALFAVNPLAVSIDTISWNPIFIPILFILTIYYSYLSLKDKSVKNMFLLGLVFSLGVSFHLQFVFVLPLILVVFYDYFKNKNFKHLIYFCIAFIIPFIPILVFDLKHDFLNIKQIFLFEGFGGNTVNRLIPVWANFTSFLFGVKSSNLLGIFVYLFTSIGLYFFSKKEKTKEVKQVLFGLSLVVALSLPIFRVLIKNPSEYYFNYLLVPILLFVSLFFEKLKKLTIVLTIIAFVYFSYKSYPLLNDANLGLKQKNNSVVFLKKITSGSNSFNVSFDVPFNEDAGFRYLLKYNEVRVSGSDKDPLIEFVLPSNRKTVTYFVDRIGLLIPKGFIKYGDLGKMDEQSKK